MDKLQILLAKGRIYESVYELLNDVGISIHLPDRTYFPTTNQKDLAFQVVKPQIVSNLLANNKADIGFSGSEASIYVYNENEKDYMKTFAQLTQKDGTFIVSREKIDDFKLEDLIGKDIIGGRANGMPEMTLEYALKQIYNTDTFIIKPSKYYLF